MPGLSAPKEMPGAEFDTPRIRSLRCSRRFRVQRSRQLAHEIAEYGTQYDRDDSEEEREFTALVISLTRQRSLCWSDPE